MKTTGVDRKEVDSSIYRKPMCDQAPKENQKPINRSASLLRNFGYSCTDAGRRLAPANKHRRIRTKTEKGCGSRWVFWKGMNLFWVFFLLYNFGVLWIVLLYFFFLAVRLRPSLCVIWLQLNGKAGGSGPSDWGRDEPCGHSEENDMSRFMDGR